MHKETKPNHSNTNHNHHSHTYSIPHQESQYEEDLEPTQAVAGRLLAGSLDLAIIFAVKIIFNIFITKYEFLIVPAYYFICLFRYSTTLGGIIYGTKVVEKTSKRTNIRLLHVISRTSIISVITLLTYYVYTNQDSNLKYILPAILAVIYINPILFTKNRLTLHDYASKSKVIKFKINNRAIVKRSIIILFVSFLIVLFSSLLENKCEQALNDKDYDNDGYLQLCYKIKDKSYNKDDYYNIGISFLRRNQSNQATTYLKKAAKLGKGEADILLIQSYSQSNLFRKAEKQANKMIKDLAASLVMSNMYIKKYEKDKDPKDLYNAYIYLNIYYMSYNDLSIKNSVMYKTKQQDILKSYYPVAKKYIKLAEEELSQEEIQEAQSKGSFILTK